MSPCFHVNSSIFNPFGRASFRKVYSFSLSTEQWEKHQFRTKPVYSSFPDQGFVPFCFYRIPIPQLGGFWNRSLSFPIIHWSLPWIGVSSVYCSYEHRIPIPELGGKWNWCLCYPIIHVESVSQFPDFPLSWSGERLTNLRQTTQIFPLVGKISQSWVC